MTTVLERAFSKQEEAARVGGAHRRRRSSPRVETGATPKVPRLWEIRILALVALIGYVGFAYWLKYEFNFTLNDALARTADAKFIIFSRDPHAAAIGLYWMPLPTFSQIPGLLLLQPLGIAEFAGPLSTAFWGAGTVLVLGRMSQELGLPRITGFLISLAYAANPVVVYYAANGMSEGASFFFLALTLRGYLRYLQDDSSAGLFLCSLGLAGAALSKYEALPLLVVMAVLLALVRFRQTSWQRTVMRVVLGVGPAVWVTVLWFFYMRIIAGSFRAFREVAETTQGGAGPVQQISYLRGVSGNLENTVEFVGSYILAYFPAALVAVPIMLLPPWRRLLGGLGVLAAGFSVIAASAYFVLVGGTFGNPRYFTPIVVMGAVAAITVASRIPGKNLAGRAFIDLGLVAAVALAGYTGAKAESQADRTQVEGESRVFKLLEGEYVETGGQGEVAVEWERLAGVLDSQLQPGELVIIDTRFSLEAELYSQKPKQFIVNADRDYESITAETGQQFDITYAVAPPQVTYNGLQGDRDEVSKLVRRQEGWQPIVNFRVGTIYKRVLPSDLAPDQTPIVIPPVN